MTYNAVMPARVHFLRDAALSFVHRHDSGLHAHRALQLTVGLTRPFRLQDSQGREQSMRFAALAPEHPHRVITGEAPVAYLFLDRGPHVYERWTRTGQAPQPPSRALLALLRDAAANAPTDAEAGTLAARWEQECLPGLRETEAEPDGRIAQALALIEQQPTRALNHRALAQAVHLSVSRFAERFRQAAGMPVRNYLLWRRLLQAVALLKAGASATAAAHAAGFSDAAHLSRSFRRILGSAPSDIA